MGTKQDLTYVFNNIYQSNLWGDKDSRSGAGSNLQETGDVRRELPKLLRKLQIKQMLDIPCGDCYWMAQTKLPHKLEYFGADIVPDIIAANRRAYPDLRFEVLDIVTDELPKVDLIFARDILGHLSNYNIDRAIRNMIMSGSKWLLTTTFDMPKDYQLPDIQDGNWRPIDVAKLIGRPPNRVIRELNVEQLGTKLLALWRIN